MPPGTTPQVHLSTVQIHKRIISSPTLRKSPRRSHFTCETPLLTHQPPLYPRACDPLPARVCRTGKNTAGKKQAGNSPWLSRGLSVAPLVWRCCAMVPRSSSLVTLTNRAKTAVFRATFASATLYCPTRTMKYVTYHARDLLLCATRSNHMNCARREKLRLGLFRFCTSR